MATEDRQTSGAIELRPREAFDEESADAAFDMLRLFTQAKRLTASRAHAGGGADPRAVLDAMQGRLAETILDDCLLFEEATVFVLFDFLSAWRVAAYGHHEPAPADGTDTALEHCYQRAVKALVPHARHAVALARASRLGVAGAVEA